MIPDCSERHHKMALYLQSIEEAGKDDVRTIFNVRGGSIVTSLTASQAMFSMVCAVAENIPGRNIVTSILEHPSAYDAASYYAEKTGKELCVAKSNAVTGGVDVEAITSLIDQDTCLLSVMYTSNISGAIYDIPEIIRNARERSLLYHMLEGTKQHKGLRHMERVHVFMDGPDLTKRDLIIGIGFDHVGFADVVREYEKRDVIVYERVVSSLYSVRMLKAFGLEGTIRVSPLHCNNLDDIDRFLEITEEIAAL